MKVRTKPFIPSVYLLWNNGIILWKYWSKPETIVLRNCLSWTFRHILTLAALGARSEQHNSQTWGSWLESSWQLYIGFESVSLYWSHSSAIWIPTGGFSPPPEHWNSRLAVILAFGAGTWITVPSPQSRSFWIDFWRNCVVSTAATVFCITNGS